MTLGADEPGGREARQAAAFTGHVRLVGVAGGGRKTGEAYLRRPTRQTEQPLKPEDAHEVFRAVPDLVHTAPEELTLGEPDLPRDVAHAPAMSRELHHSPDETVGSRTGASALDQHSGKFGHHTVATG